MHVITYDCNRNNCSFVVLLSGVLHISQLCNIGDEDDTNKVWALRERGWYRRLLITFFDVNSIEDDKSDILTLTLFWRAW